MLVEGVSDVVVQVAARYGCCPPTVDVSGQQSGLFSAHVRTFRSHHCEVGRVGRRQARAHPVSARRVELVPSDDVTRVWKRDEWGDVDFGTKTRSGKMT